MSWADTRNALDVVCHATFSEPGTYRHSDGTGELALEGVLTQKVEMATADDGHGYESTTPEYEIRKRSATPALTAAAFRRQGRLTLDSGQVFVVTYVRQEDFLIWLGLAPVEE
jgi:hypothetical protein